MAFLTTRKIGQKRKTINKYLSSFIIYLPSFLRFLGEYSCLKVNLLFKREFSYYLIQIYIPCCMLVIVSWVSFWLDANAVPARVSLGVTTLLTMATQTTGINNSLPPVSYTKVNQFSFENIFPFYNSFSSFLFFFFFLIFNPKGDWRLDGSLFDFCFWRFTWIRPRQLRIKIRRPSR